MNTGPSAKFFIFLITIPINTADAWISEASAPICAGIAPIDDLGSRVTTTTRHGIESVLYWPQCYCYWSGAPALAR
jgi:hypothetical protein